MWNKSFTCFQDMNMTRMIAISWLLLSKIFHQCRQCRSKIRLHVLCSLILIYIGCKGNHSHERHFKGFLSTTQSCISKNLKRNVFERMWEKERMLIQVHVTSICFLSYNIFSPIIDRNQFVSKIIVIC